MRFVDKMIVAIAIQFYVITLISVIVDFAAFTKSDCLNNSPIQLRKYKADTDTGLEIIL